MRVSTADFIEHYSTLADRALGERLFAAKVLPERQSWKLAA